MIETKLNTKFYLAPHIYYAKTAKGAFLLYNTKTGEHIESNSSICCNLIDRIYEPANLGMIDISDIDFLDKEVYDFIEEIKNKNFGKIIEQKEDASQYINLLPILNLQRDVERLKTDREVSIGEDLINYLNELNIYINNSCTQNCPNCNIHYKQVKACYKEVQNKYLDLSTIKRVLNSLAYSQLNRINILGGNIFQHPYFAELLNLLKEYHFNFHLWSHYANFDNQTMIKENFSYDVIIAFPIEDIFWNRCIDLLKDKQASYHFYIANEEEYNKSETLIGKHKIENYSISPIYTENNLNFFEENIYIEKDDIFENIIPFRHIFRNQKLNSNYFGKLYVLPGGSVKASMNTSVLGNIKNNSLLEIIYCELDRNTTWRQIRDKEPCSSCLYQFLCPPPSNYETVINKPNLCHIKNL
ncbi:TIGR04150 pseudo-rSAM protein [Bacteroidales bacterium OttesenSCG-928-I14]|nr:TIGR04150 pseudo-rSAM protein [Bacteroidales bacterium OttesenSCG-928-I14]